MAGYNLLDLSPKWLYCGEGPSVAVDGRLGQDGLDLFGGYGYMVRERA